MEQSERTRHDVVLYTRGGCCLCDQALDELKSNGLVPQIVDIDQDEQLQASYGDCVPVVMIDGKVRFRGHVNRVLLGRILRHAAP